MGLMKRGITILVTLFLVMFGSDGFATFFGIEGSSNINYQYDDLYRLTKVSRSDGTVIEYQYDASGNRMRKIVSIQSNTVSAGFSAIPTSGQAPLSVTFSDQSAGALTSWAWDFGDGGTSTAQNPVHVYQNAGTYSVSLTISNSGGSDTKTNTDYIVAQSPVTQYQLTIVKSGPGT